jgi:6,7-dimethyl-8-ribityllumazine synthase
MNQTSQTNPATLPSPAVAGLRPMKVAVIAASWHQEIISCSTNAIRQEFDRRGFPPDSLELHKVPGAFEIPLCAMRLARTAKYDAIIACGLVVNGGIYRHEFVASAVIDGLMRVQLDTDIPTFSAVLTPRDFHEHEEHQAFFAAHFVKKGVEVAQACLQTLEALAELPRAA